MKQTTKDEEKLRELYKYLKSGVYQDFKKYEILHYLFRYCLFSITLYAGISIFVEPEKMHYIKENGRWCMLIVGNIMSYIIGRKFEREKIKNKLDISNSDINFEDGKTNEIANEDITIHDKGKN